MNMDNIGTLVEREVVYVKKAFPTGFRIIDRLVPVEFTEVNGEYFPRKYQRVPIYIPTDYEVIEVPILVPKF